MFVEDVVEVGSPSDIVSPAESDPLAGLLPVVEEESFADVLLVLLSDVEVPGVSCSVPLLTQPVRVAAIAPTRREIMIFFIYVPFPVQTNLLNLNCLSLKQY